jgi:hypothetical protein
MPAAVDPLRPWMNTVTMAVTMTHSQPRLPVGLLPSALPLGAPVSSTSATGCWPAKCRAACTGRSSEALITHRIASRDGGTEGTVAINGTEYLELLAAAGVQASAFPEIQAVQQHSLWSQVGGPISPESVEAAIRDLSASDPSFSMEGASWTNDLSWVEGYGNVLEPMNRLSSRFHQVFDPLVARDPASTRSAHYLEALLHVLLLETSCFRYWGQGTWSDYALEIQRRWEGALHGTGRGHLKAASE